MARTNQHVTILLLPDNLPHSDSVIRQPVNGSDAADWQRVEVLGWLYQCNAPQ